MLKVLLKKQFMEVNQFFFVNKKTGQRKTRGKIILAAGAWAVALVVLLGMFFMLSMRLGGIMIPAGVTWMYFATLGVIALVMGIFGTIINMYSALFHAKDNELLLSLPIPARTIIMSRMVMSFLLALMYTALTWLPVVACYVIVAGDTPAGAQASVVAASLVMLLVLSLLVMVLSCALGWVVAAIASRIKNKSLVTVVATVAILGLYYYAYFNAIGALQDPESWLPGMEISMQSAAWPLYQLGLACAGGLVQLLVIAFLALVLLAVCWLGMSKSFLRIASGGASRNQEKVGYAVEQVKSSSLKQALQRRELKRWLSNATYLLNTGLGVVIILLAAGAALVNMDVLQQVIVELQMEMPDLVGFIPRAIVAAFMMIVGMNAVATPSVSLEGKNLWILRSLPIPTSDILDSKVNLQLKVNLIPAALCTAAVAFSFSLDATTIVFMAAAVAVYTCFMAQTDLILGLLNVNLNWTSEVVPVKQNGAVIMALFGGWGMAIVVGALAYFTVAVLTTTQFLLAFMVLFLALTMLARKWLHTEGVRRFEAL